MGEEVDDPRAAERVGAFLADKWTLERLLGSGGMGAVYAARHRNGARAALKILHPDLARVAEVRERFLREGYAANRVEHRGAVKVLDDDFVKDGPDAGSAYLVMELLDGESLEARSLRPPPVNELEMLEIMEAVLDVLVAAHANGVIHRDLKPENLFLAKDPDGGEGIRVKVLDFGLARINEVASQTSAGLALGTPSFMSPEQAAGKADEIDGQTDIFALGATAFRIITGRRIHEAENVVQLVVKMATIPAPPVREVMPSLSEPFARVIDKALAFEKADRYATAAAMRDDVRAAIAELRGDDADATHVAPYSDRMVPVAPRKKSSPTMPQIEDRAPESPAPSVRDPDYDRSLAYDPTPPSRLPILLLFAAVVSFVAFKFGDELQEKLEQLARPLGFATIGRPAGDDGADPSASDTPPAPANSASVTSGEVGDASTEEEEEIDGGATSEADGGQSLAAMFDEMVEDVENVIAAPATAEDAGSAEVEAEDAGEPASTATSPPPAPPPQVAAPPRPTKPPSPPPAARHHPPPRKPPPKRPTYHPPTHKKKR